MEVLKKITIIGSGNVATHLGMALFQKGFKIETVYSKRIENATILANKIDAHATNNLTQINKSSNLYLVAISDDAIESVLEAIDLKHQLIVHTSGSVPMQVFEKNGFSNYGIFYPLQTFSKEKEITMKGVPFCIEGVNKEIESELIELAKCISTKVYSINSGERKKIHLAAVFACNFSNHLYTIAEELLVKYGLDFELLQPLILETAKKITSNSPKKMQTGPAIRNDTQVMKKQLEMLDGDEKLQELYRLISERIQKS